LAAYSSHHRAAAFSPPDIRSACPAVPRMALKAMDGVTSGLALARRGRGKKW